jgi:hypothetical protein
MRSLRSQGQIQKWSCDGLEVTIETGIDQICINGDLVVRVEHERFGSVRPKFRCPECDRGCRVLYERDGNWTCRRCAKLDYRSRRERTSASFDTQQLVGELERKFGDG